MPSAAAWVSCEAKTFPEQIISQKAYDTVGNTIILTDTMGNMTRHFYDKLNRGVGSVTNWTGTINSIEDFPSCYSLPENRETDLCTMRHYDKVGNTIIMTDAAGRMTRTFYDDLNRVEATVQNWNPATLSTPADCVIGSDNMNEENICSLPGYDNWGRSITSTNALGRTSLTVYDAQSRPYIQVQNWDGTPINTIADCSFPPVQPDVNLCTVTFFDAQGRGYATQDPMGDRRETGYDDFSRVVTSTQWLDDGTPVFSVTGYDERGNAYQHTDAEGNTTTTTYDVLNRVKTTVSAEGVTMTRTYNALGQVVTTTNSLGYTTVKEYDGLGRVVKSWDGAQNLTQTIYDALGNRVGVIDPNGVRTTYLYDQLQRQVGLIQNDTGGSQTVDSNILTSYQYDVKGNLQVVTSALGISDTVTLYDSLNRPYYTENAVGDGVTTQYDALGYRRVVTDGNDAVTTFGYDGLGRLETTNFLNDGETITVTYNAAGQRTSVSNGLGTVSYEYDSLGRMVVVTDTQNARVEYVYDKVGNRTNLTYPPSASPEGSSGQAAKVVTYTYNMDNQLDTVTAWDGGLTDYEYDDLGRLVTMTLPTGITSVGAYDGANRVTGLTHRNGSGVLLGQYEYDLDGVGQPQVVTETLASPTLVTVTEQFLENSGLLVVEAEAGETTAGADQTWQEQTNQSGYAGDSYLRALPDVGNVWEAGDATDTPTAAFTVQVNTTGSYAAWVRGYASDAGGDSVHLTVDGATADSSARLTGFAPDSWTWSRLTMSNTEATLSFPTAGAYDLQLLMREDGMRVDKLLLITDTNYIPTGVGPAASATALITDTVVGSLDTHVITYAYDELYRLTEADYSGAISGNYQYVYNAVGSRMAYTATITSTVVTTYTYDAANQLETARSSDTNVLWHYVYDGNGQRVRQVPGSLTPDEGEVRYTFNQAGQMTQIENHDGSDYVVQANVGYDGLGQRVLGITVVEGVPMTVTYTLDGILGQPIMIANPLETTLILYGQYGLGEYKLNAPAGEQWQYYLGDEQLSVRQLTDGDGNVTLTRTYGPYGVMLAQAGNGSALFGYAGAQSGASGLWYFGNGYFDPQTGQFLATGANPLAPLAANVLANPGSLLFGPLMLVSWRRRKKKKLHPATLIFLGVVLAVALTSCQDGDPIATQAPETTPEVTGAPAPTQPGNPTATPPSEGTGNSIEVPLIVCPEPGETTDSAPPLETPPIETTPNPTVPPTNNSIPLGFKFTSLPLDLTQLDKGRDGEDFGYYDGVQGFGKTLYASKNPVYVGLGRNHNGIDFAAPVGTPVVSNINVDATARVINDYSIPDANPKVILEFLHEGSQVWIIYGHIDATIPSGVETLIPANSRMQLGLLADVKDYRDEDDSHLHLGVTNYGEFWEYTSLETKVEKPTYYNPLLYFESGVLPNNLFEGQIYVEGTSTSLSHFTTP